MKRVLITVELDVVVEPSKLDDLLDHVTNELEYSVETLDEVVLAQASVDDVVDVK